MSSLRLTFAEENQQLVEKTKNFLAESAAVQQAPRPVFIYTTKSLSLDEALENRLIVGLTAAGFRIVTLSSINNIMNDLLAGKPAGCLIAVDDFEEVTLLLSMMNTSTWNVITQATTVVLASARANNPTFRSTWESLISLYVQPSPPDVVEVIALFNRAKVSEFVPFGVNIELSEKRIPLAINDFTRFFVEAPRSTGYEVTLRTEGVPVLSTSVPIPNTGTPPFEGFLRTNIGVATVDGRHVISLVGEGGGLTKSDTITFIAR